MTQAGRELDARVAQEVMGATIPAWLEIPGGLSTMTSYEIVPAYSTDISAAWLVRERMYQLGWRFHLSQHGDQIWNCRFTPEDTAAYQYAVDQSPFVAICIAALKALEESPR